MMIHQFSGTNHAYTSVETYEQICARSLIDGKSLCFFLLGDKR